MAETLRSEFARWRQGRGVRLPRSGRWLALALGSALLPASIRGTAQVAPAKDPQKSAPLGAKASPAAEPARPASPPARLSPAQPALPPIEPVRPPVVAWDGSRLTIDAENSTLSDVLLAIRSRTGASIEMPGSASAERVAIHIGPAPIREVLSSLLYGTNFNYVIQSSEGDAGGLGKVMLISRDGEASDDVIDEDVRADRRVQPMPGYGAHGKRNFDAAHPRATRAAADTAAAAAEPANEDNTPATNDASSNDTPSTESQPVASTNSTDSSPAQPDATLTAAGTAASADPSSTSNDTSAISNMEQGLQKLYEQRKQIQAQQNQGPPKTSPEQ